MWFHIGQQKDKQTKDITRTNVSDIRVSYRSTKKTNKQKTSLAQMSQTSEFHTGQQKYKQTKDITRTNVSDIRVSYRSTKIQTNKRHHSHKCLRHQSFIQVNKNTNKQKTSLAQMSQTSEFHTGQQKDKQTKDITRTNVLDNRVSYRSTKRQTNKRHHSHKCLRHQSFIHVSKKDKQTKDISRTNVSDIRVSYRSTEKTNK